MERNEKEERTWHKHYRNWRIRWIDPIILIGKTKRHLNVSHRIVRSHHIWTNDSITKNGCRTKEIEMCIRVCLCASVRDTKIRNRTSRCLFFFVDWRMNLQFKSIEFFHFATHIYVRSTYRSLWKFISSSYRNAMSENTRTKKCVLLVDIEFPRKIVSLHDRHHHHQLQHRKGEAIW